MPALIQGVVKTDLVGGINRQRYCIVGLDKHGPTVNLSFRNTINLAPVNYRKIYNNSNWFRFAGLVKKNSLLYYRYAS